MRHGGGDERAQLRGVARRVDDVDRQRRRLERRQQAAQPAVREILVGTLAIDVVDARRQQVVWRGLGTKEVDTDAKAEERDKTISKAVTKIMRHYPPKLDDD